MMRLGCNLSSFCQHEMCDKELKVPALGRENIKVSRKKEMKKVSTLRKKIIKVQELCL